MTLTTLTTLITNHLTTTYPTLNPHDLLVLSPNTHGNLYIAVTLPDGTYHELDLRLSSTPADATEDER